MITERIDIEEKKITVDVNKEGPSDMSEKSWTLVAQGQKDESLKMKNGELIVELHII